jgi:uncharacterized protein (TIGR02145 family)
MINQILTYNGKVLQSNDETWAINTGAVDIDGNVYAAVVIGTQEWLTLDLKTTKYRDGTTIPNITDASAWVIDSSGAYCWMNNDIGYKATYGALYNWYVVNSSHGLTPPGWRVPTISDLNKLITYLGGGIIAGGKLKEASTAHWLTPNTGATNETGFTALPGGGRYDIDGNFYPVKYYNWSWLSDAYDSSYGYYYSLAFDSAEYSSSAFLKQRGLSIRCIRDV